MKRPRKKIKGTFKHGLAGYSNRKCRCKVCRLTYNAYQSDYARKVRKNPSFNFKKKRRTDLWRLKGIQITWERYEKLFEGQEGKCAICGAALRLLAWPRGTKGIPACVDHCHITGKIRGLLCGQCNRKAGLLEHYADLVPKILTYLKERG